VSRPASTAAAVLVALAALIGSLSRAAAGTGEPLQSVLVEIEPGPASGERAAFAAAPIAVYLNTAGGVFSPGEPNDSRQNVSSVPDLSVEIPPWGAPAADQAALLECVSDLFAPFGLELTSEDPGSAPHLEAVIGGDPTMLGLMPTVAGVSPFLTNCGVIDNSIVFVFPLVVGNDPRRLCETVAQEIAHSFGLDHEYLCEDPMTYLTGCGDKSFLFQDSVCGEFEARDCRCSRSQNSARMLLDRLGRGSGPALWLNAPSTGDLLAAGFPVQAVINHPPDALQLYVDGVMADSISPDDSGDAYQFVDFDTADALRTGTHHVKLVARFGDEERSVAAIVDVEGTPPDSVVSEGCAAGGGGGAGAALLVAALALCLAGRRRAAGLGLLLVAAASQTGCQTSVFGSPSDDIESGCRGAGEVSTAIGVLWSPPAGPCTATLVGTSALVTAAHCVADAAEAADPIVIVLGEEQYIADAVEVFPDWEAGAPADDVAALLVTRAVDGVVPLALTAEAPVDGAEFTLVGHGEWRPDEVRDAERQALVGAVTDVDDRSFGYAEEVDDGCLAGRGGGPVLAADSDRLLGLHGEDRVMRMDRYACWLSCATSPGLVDPDCDCTRADFRPCGECGAEFLDFASRMWTPCAPADDLNPCEDGLTCDADAQCVEPPEADPDDSLPRTSRLTPSR
jgi:hypothetical protein